MESLKKIGKVNLICGICYIVAALLLWVVGMGFNLLVTEVEGEEALVLIFTIVFFVFQTALMAVAGIYAISTGIACKKLGEAGKKAGKLLVTSAVVKGIFTLGLTYLSVILCAAFMPGAGVVGFAVSAAIIVTVVVDIIEARKEKKKQA